MKFSILLLVFIFLCNSKIKACVSDTSLPESKILIPIQINLKPIYALAERNVDTAFTSPNYPNDWVELDCATRYKYHFRRSPLGMKTSGTTMELAFTGFYQIVGSSRACVGGAALSPWTPPCSCGFKEGERKVAISFTSSLSFRPNHQVHVAVKRNEPQALNKCSVCFWGQDITTQVLNGIKKELDLAKKAIEDSFAVLNTRPYMQQAWNQLQNVYPIAGLGFLSLNPKRLHMENIYAKDDLLNISIGVTATPVISFERTNTANTLVPNLTPAGGKNGFTIFLDAALNYDSLSQVTNQYLKGKRFDFKEGFLKRHVIVDSCRIAGDTRGNMVIRMQFSGSHDGVVYFVGKPYYNAETKSIEVANLEYDLETRDFLLKTAKWFFNKKIISELKKYTSFNLSGYYDSAANNLNTWLNKEWTKGIKSNGKIKELKLLHVKALPEFLSIQTACDGQLSLKIDELSWSF